MNLAITVSGALTLLVLPYVHASPELKAILVFEFAAMQLWVLAAWFNRALKGMA